MKCGFDFFSLSSGGNDGSSKILPDSSSIHHPRLASQSNYTARRARPDSEDHEMARARRVLHPIGGVKSGGGATTTMNAKYVWFDCYH